MNETKAITTHGMLMMKLNTMVKIMQIQMCMLGLLLGFALTPMLRTIVEIFSPPKPSASAWEWKKQGDLGDVLRYKGALDPAVGWSSSHSLIQYSENGGVSYITTSYISHPIGVK